MLTASVLQWSFDEVPKRRSRFSKSSQSRSDVKGRRPVLKLKKRHVERLTRLPTKMFGNCLLGLDCSQKHVRRTAPVLVWRSLRIANRKLVHSLCTENSLLSWHYASLGKWLLLGRHLTRSCQSNDTTQSIDEASRSENVGAHKQANFPSYLAGRITM